MSTVTNFVIIVAYVCQLTRIAYPYTTNRHAFDERAANAMGRKQQDTYTFMYALRTSFRTTSKKNNKEYICTIELKQYKALVENHFLD